MDSTASISSSLNIDCTFLGCNRHRLAKCCDSDPSMGWGKTLDSSKFPSGFHVPSSRPPMPLAEATRPAGQSASRPLEARPRARCLCRPPAGPRASGRPCRESPCPARAQTRPFRSPPIRSSGNAGSYSPASWTQKLRPSRVWGRSRMWRRQVALENLAP